MWKLRELILNKYRYIKRRLEWVRRRWYRRFSKYIEPLYKVNPIIVFLITLGFLPFVTLLCNEILVYTIPLFVLFTYGLNKTLDYLALGDDDEIRASFLLCVELCAWKTMRHVYSYKYCKLACHTLSKVLMLYVDAVVLGQDEYRLTYAKMCRSFSMHRYAMSYARIKV